MKEDPILTARLSQVAENGTARQVDEMIPKVSNEDMFRLVVTGESVLEREKKFAEGLIRKVNRYRGAYSIYKHTNEITDMKLVEMNEDDTFAPKL